MACADIIPDSTTNTSTSDAFKLEFDVEDKSFITE